MVFTDSRIENVRSKKQESVYAKAKLKLCRLVSSGWTCLGASTLYILMDLLKWAMHSLHTHGIGDIVLDSSTLSDKQGQRKKRYKLGKLALMLAKLEYWEKVSTIPA